MKKLAWGLVVLLGIVHYDFWFWDDRTLVFGFLPVGLAYQVLISILSGVAWFLVVRYAWPEHVERWAGARSEDPPG